MHGEAVQIGDSAVPVRESEWLVPSAALTSLSALFALAFIPSYSGIMPALLILPLWMLVAALIGCVYAMIVMIAARVEHPLARIRAMLGGEWRTLLFWVCCLLLTGLNMIAFMWVKPMLNYMVPFSADPWLAELDSALFFGHDPWTLFSGLNSTAMAIFYHRGWIAMMILTLIAVIAAPPSPTKSATMLTYFVLWSVVGPIVHVMLPAAGPIFYAQLGYGDRFASLASVPETQAVANYLWTIYSSTGFGPGSGISAMPSLHIATTAWMLIAVRLFARPLFVPMAIAGVLIFLLSISLGWHYAADGLVGGGCAWLCHRLLHRAFSRRPEAPHLTPATT